nr:hypothetical protein [Pedobacter kyonggii]
MDNLIFKNQINRSLTSISEYLLTRDMCHSNFSSLLLNKIFFFCYSKLTKNYFYSDLAFELLENTYVNLFYSTSYFGTNWLPSLGFYTVKFIKNNFIEIDNSSMFDYIDERIVVKERANKNLAYNIIRALYFQERENSFVLNLSEKKKNDTRIYLNSIQKNNLSNLSYFELLIFTIVIQTTKESLTTSIKKLKIKILKIVQIRLKSIIKVETLFTEELFSLLYIYILISEDLAKRTVNVFLQKNASFLSNYMHSFYSTLNLALLNKRFYFLPSNLELDAMNYLVIQTRILNSLEKLYEMDSELSDIANKLVYLIDDNAINLEVLMCNSYFNFHE